MRFRQILLGKFLLVVVPVFLVLSGIGMGLVSQHDVDLERNGLSARVGNLAARTASALARHDAMAEPALAQDLLAPLAADRAISCVELRSAKTGTTLNQLPPAQGCSVQGVGEVIELDVTDDGDITLHLVITEKEIAEATELRRNLVIVALLAALLIALFSAVIGFQVIISRPLNRLLSSIQRNTDSGERHAVDAPPKDELGDVIRAYNEMLSHEDDRERQLKGARDELSDLNADLEQRVERRTQELSKSETNLRQIIESLPTAIFVATEGRLVFANRAAVSQSKAGSADDLIGISALDLFHPSAHADIEERRKIIHQADAPMPFLRMKRMRLDGSEFEAEGVSTPLTWEGRQAVLAVIMDITERKQTEQTLSEAKKRAEAAAQIAERAQREAESANRAKSDFLATISHELRTPMNGVLGMAGLMLKTELSADQQRFTERIKLSGDALLALLNDILDLSKIEAGRMELENAPFSFSAMLGSVTALMEPRAQQKGLNCEISVTPDFHDALIGDATRIRQILFNLVGNAIKFTETGGIRVAVSQQTVVGDMLEIRCEVIDTGCGIPEDAQPRIFEKFAQADESTTRQFGGTGLGLAICRNLATLMGGTIGVQSAPGEGSTFWFTVRCRQGTATAETDQNSGTASEAPAQDTGGRRLRILVADDNVVNQEIAAATLEMEGHHVDIVSDGVEAVAAVQNFPYDVVLMDIHMPQMDGLTATSQIRDLPGDIANIPIIALTADAMVGDREKFLSAGMNDYASKPFEPAQLFSAIDRCVRPEV